MTRPMIIDSFAGGGGASTGIEMALGRSPDIRILSGGTDLEGLHLVQQHRVVGGPVLTRMNTTVTVRTKANHKTRVVGSAIAGTSNVMRFQVGRAIRAQEGRRLAASFTLSFAAGQDVVANVTRSLVDGALNLSNWNRGRGRRVGSCSQRRQIRGYHLGCLNGINHSFQRTQFENNRLSNNALGIGALRIVPAFADHLTAETQRARRVLLFEEQKVLAVFGMVGDGAIAPHHRHVAFLAFAIIFKHAIVPPSVSIAVVETGFTGHDDDQVMAGGRNDAALLLPLKPRVDISAACVGAPWFKSPSHRFPQTHATEYYEGRARKCAAPLAPRIQRVIFPEAAE